jgi:hypothetical protein
VKGRREAEVVDDSPEDHLSFSSESGREPRVVVVWMRIMVVPGKGTGGLRNLSLKHKRGDSSPHGPDR